jgi:DNA-binding CsgD family transcriptional regulator
MICLRSRPAHIVRPQANIGHTHLTALLNHISLPMFLLNEERLLVYANATGHEQLNQANFVYLKSGRLQIRSDEHSIRGFEAAVLAAAEGKDHSGDKICTMSLGEHRKTKASVTIVPISGVEETDSLVAIILTAQEPEESEVILRLQMTLDLTPAEARIAFLICRGGRPKSIADHLSVSVNTVKSHLASVLSKTGCSNQAALCVLAGQLLTPIRATSKAST